MNNKTFIQRLSQATGYTQDDSQKMLYSVVDAMNEQFQEGEAVAFPGFGTFEVKKRMERIVVNPATKQRLLVPPKLVVGFKPVASIRRILKEGRPETFDGSRLRGLSASPIVAHLVQKHGMKAHDAELFISEMVVLVNEALRDEKQVKIKGLGTFKVIDVKERESVDVNTGERIVIEGRSKISFTPDSVMKDLVNKPFSQFETVVLNEGVTFDDIDESTNEDDTETLTFDEEPVPMDEGPSEESEEAPAMTDEAPLEHSEEEPVLADEGTSEHSEEEAPPIEDEPVEIDEGPMEYSEEEPAAEETMPATDEEPFVIVGEDSSEPPLIVSDEPVEAEHPIDIGETEESGRPGEPAMLTADINQPEEEENEDMEKGKKKTPWCMYLVVGLLSALIGFGAGWTVRERVYVKDTGSQPEVLPVEADTVEKNDSAEAERLLEEQLRSDSLEQVRQDSIRKARQDSLEKARQDSLEKVQLQLEQVKMELEAQKKAEQAAREAEQKKAQEQARKTASDPSALASARRQAELGAYTIVGTQETITVREGQTMARLSKFYFGDGMECYLQIHNGVTEVKPGMKLKIPKLQIKKKR